MKKKKCCMLVGHNFLPIWVLGVVFLLTAFPDICTAQSDVATLIANGMNPVAAVEQAISEGQDPAEVAGAAAGTAPEFAYEIALSAANAAPAAAEAIGAAVLQAAPNTSGKIVNAIIKAAPEVGNGILKVIIEIDPVTGEEVVRVIILAASKQSGDNGPEIILVYKTKSKKLNGFRDTDHPGSPR